MRIAALPLAVAVLALALGLSLPSRADAVAICSCKFQSGNTLDGVEKPSGKTCAQLKCDYQYSTQECVCNNKKISYKAVEGSMTESQFASICGGITCTDSAAAGQPGAATGTAGKAGGGGPEKFKIPTGDLPAIFGRVIRLFLGISGSLAFATVMLGGILYLTSAGNPERITKARNMIVWAGLGLFVIFASYALVATILKAVTGSVGVGVKDVTEQGSLSE